jgi:hypothetical protein
MADSTLVHYMQSESYHDDVEELTHAKGPTCTLGGISIIPPRCSYVYDLQFYKGFWEKLRTIFPPEIVPSESLTVGFDNLKYFGQFLRPNSRCNLNPWDFHPYGPA